LIFFNLLIIAGTVGDLWYVIVDLFTDQRGYPI